MKRIRDKRPAVRTFSPEHKERFEKNEARITEIDRELRAENEALRISLSPDWIRFFKVTRSLEAERKGLIYEQGRAKDWLAGLGR